jgi:aspartate 1-decarboxylase
METIENNAGRQHGPVAGPTERSCMRWVMRSQIHTATVTEANLAYVGSITIDEDLLDRVGLWPGEKVLVVSNTSGARLETYVIVGPRGSGSICMNGAAAHLISTGEQVIIMGFELTERPLHPRAALVDGQNRFVRWLGERYHETAEV